jgi:hypothetical protein
MTCKPFQTKFKSAFFTISSTKLSVLTLPSSLSMSQFYKILVKAWKGIDKLRKFMVNLISFSIYNILNEIVAALYSGIMRSGFQSLGRNITPLSFNNNCNFSIKFSDCSFLPDSLHIVECSPKQTKQSTWVNSCVVICLPFCTYDRSCDLLLTWKNRTMF